MKKQTKSNNMNQVSKKPAHVSEANMNQVSKKPAHVPKKHSNVRSANIARHYAQPRHKLIVTDEDRLAYIRPEPSSRYNVIYADPPWQYNDRRTSDTRFSGGAMAHYDVMDINALCQIDVNAIADDNALLFLWCTWPIMLDPKLMGVHRVCEAWGFVPSTVFKVWTKTNRSSRSVVEVASTMSRLASLSADDAGLAGTDAAVSLIEKMMFFGIGWFSKSNTEFVVVCRRKKGRPFKSQEANYISQLTYAPIAKHSEKPFSVRDDIETFCGQYLCPDCRLSYDHELSRHCHVSRPERQFASRSEPKERRLKPLCTSPLVQVKRLEMFSRHIVPGWDAMGWDLSWRDIREDVEHAKRCISNRSSRQ